MLRYTWTCSCCGRQFHELPIHWVAQAPAHYEEMTEAERQTRAELSADFCAIDDSVFFIRGVIEISLIGHAEMFSWGVWASLSAASMEKVRRAWKNFDQYTDGPFFGWLDTSLPYESSTLNLKTHVHLRAPPLTPFVELEPTNHPLAIEQRQGMSLKRAIQIAEALLPRH